MTLNFKQAFVHAVNTPSDINEHLPLMNILAKLCTHVTEFGVRWGASATAWLNNDVVVRGYDIVAYEPAIELFSQAQAAGKDAQLIIRDTLSLGTIENTDLLFIDSLHTYRQVTGELAYAKFVSKFIVLHDTVLFGDAGEDGSQPGINQAVREFLAANRDWTVMEHRTNNNGLTVLTRRSFF
jgi:cephalosporin hydroxylase